MAGKRVRRRVVLPAELRCAGRPARRGQPRAAAVFQAHAEGYDAERRRLLPCFDAFYAAAIDALGLCERPLGRVLDLVAPCAQRWHRAGCSSTPSRSPADPVARRGLRRAPRARRPRPGCRRRRVGRGRGTHGP